MPAMSPEEKIVEPEDEAEDEYVRFERLARKLVNTPKPSAAAADEPTADGSERKEDGRDGD
jgi:hypothetical protein